MSTALVELHDVALTYRRGDVTVQAVRGATGRVEARTATVLVGPSGAGKSSLLHLIAGLETPTSGSVTWPGLGGQPRVDPTLVGFLFQAPSLIPELDVSQNVALPLLLAGQDEPAATAKSLAALTELDLLQLWDALPEDLSGGQAQRVALARALAGDPRLLVADEPTGQLDRASADHIAAVLLDRGSRAGLTVVVSTHDLVLAEQFPQRWQIRDGHVLEGATS